MGVELPVASRLDEPRAVIQQTAIELQFPTGHQLTVLVAERLPMGVDTDIFPENHTLMAVE